MKRNKNFTALEPFKERVIDVVLSIPKGEVMSYSEVAKRAGSLNAGRAVGTIMSQNKNKMVPCHRVIRSDGKIGGYNSLRGISKEALLKKEGYLL